MIFPIHTILSLLALISVIIAAPIPAPPDRPPVPSVKELQGKLNVQPDKTLFHSGVPGSVPVAHAKANDLQTLSKAWKEPKFPDQFQTHAGDSRQFFNHASEALAKSTAGKAQVMLPENSPTSGKPSSTWSQHEFPHLKRPGVELHRLDVGAGGKVVGSHQVTDKATGKPPMSPKPADLQGKPVVPPKPQNLQGKPVVPPKPASLKSPVSPKSPSPVVPAKPGNLQVKGKGKQK